MKNHIEFKASLGGGGTQVIWISDFVRYMCLIQFIQLKIPKGLLL